MQADFCAELLKQLKENSIHTAVDTCGSVAKEAFDKVLPYTDVFLYDLKAFDEDVHIRCTGQSNKQILENINYLDACGKKIEVFGKSHLDEIAAEFGLPVLARLPIDPAVAEHFDNGQMESVNTEAMADVLKAVENI